eukprot:TRINITY_DN32577_c0_g2_i5.p1 TRINITY_DN32577_c0_g2~~TRINITY_DN32577_c0_g2_i5.p1  ORF type:complete len:185 (+),score=-9.36 TRINITY_DN32577_c0_g2_i5:507-1061(+)
MESAQQQNQHLQISSSNKKFNQVNFNTQAQVLIQNISNYSKQGNTFQKKLKKKQLMKLLLMKQFRPKKIYTLNTSKTITQYQIEFKRTLQLLLTNDHYKEYIIYEHYQQYNDTVYYEADQPIFKINILIQQTTPYIYTYKVQYKEEHTIILTRYYNTQFLVGSRQNINQGIQQVDVAYLWYPQP